MPRLLRVVKPLREFFLKIMGNISIPLLSIITVVAILWLAVVNMQFFGYLHIPQDCQRVGGGHFDNILSVSPHTNIGEEFEMGFMLANPYLHKACQWSGNT